MSDQNSQSNKSKPEVIVIPAMRTDIIGVLKFAKDTPSQVCRFNVCETDGITMTMEEIIESCFGRPVDARFIAQGVRKEPVFLVLGTADLKRLMAVSKDWDNYKEQVLSYVRDNMNTVVNWSNQNETDDGSGTGESPEPTHDDSV